MLTGEKIGVTKVEAEYRAAIDVLVGGTGGARL